MTDEPVLDQKQLPDDRSTNATSIAIWFAASLVATAVLSIAVTHTPSRIRLIGLFPVAFSVVIGWLTVILANQLNVFPSPRITLITAGVMALSGWALITQKSFQLERTVNIKSPDDQVAARLLKEFERQSGQRNGESSTNSTATLFREYLSRRLRQLGDWSSPWPECFWIGELLAAATVAGITSHRFLLAPTTEAVE